MREELGRESSAILIQLWQIFGKWGTLVFVDYSFHVALLFVVLFGRETCENFKNNFDTIMKPNGDWSVLCCFLTKFQ